MYEVRFTPEARRDLARIPDKVRPAIFEMISDNDMLESLLALNLERSKTVSPQQNSLI